MLEEREREREREREHLVTLGFLFRVDKRPRLGDAGQSLAVLDGHRDLVVVNDAQDARDDDGDAGAAPEHRRRGAADRVRPEDAP